IADQAGMTEETAAQQLASWCDVAAEVTTLRIDEVRGYGGPKINYHAGTPAQLISCHQRQPPIHAQTRCINIAIAYAGQLQPGPSEHGVALEPARQLIHNDLRLFCRAHTNQPATVNLPLLSAKQ